MRTGPRIGPVGWAAFDSTERPLVDLRAGAGDRRVDDGTIGWDEANRGDDGRTARGRGVAPPPEPWPLSREWLRAVGIESSEDLEAVGAVEAWRRVKERFPGRVTIVLLYGLEGALLGLPWNDLPPEVVERLNDAVGPATPARGRPGTGGRRTA
ncbi:MAG TPA: TfoX/Sxy family protein [Thermomicrobiales bacterium]|nr:TfoX/Sxy family protein [Thermomicrobiales bacterium]